MRDKMRDIRDLRYMRYSMRNMREKRLPIILGTGNVSPGVNTKRATKIATRFSVLPTRKIHINSAVR